MSRRGAVLAGNRVIGNTGRGGVAGLPAGAGPSPLARELASGMGVPTQPQASSSAPPRPQGPTAGWGDAYGGIGLPRPSEDFTDGAFGPFSPTQATPVDQVDASGQPAPRREEYRVGWNLPVGQPGTEGLKLADFNTLRTIADLYSVARACIRFLKSQITSLEWEIMPTKDAAKAMRGDKGAMKDFGKRRAAAVKFFKRPDPDYFSWQTWLSDVLEEALVYDALSIVIREKWGKGRGRGILGSDLDCLNLISGPTVRPLYDIHGARPRPPAVGYQQYLYGVPRVDLWSMITQRDLDESGLRGEEFRAFGGTQLLYLPMSPRRWTPYGFSPIEQALVPIMTGLQKQAYQLDYFREGTIPGVFVSPGGANADMSPTQIRELQNALNAIAGDPAWKHKILVLPADSRVEPMRSQALADALDEIVMMQTCMGFGVFPMQIGIMPKVSATTSPGAANQMAKMSGDQQDRTTTRPMVIFLATIMDYILTEVCDQDDMRFVFDGMEEEEDEETKTNLIINQISHGLATIDEGRDELGKQPFGEAKTSDPGWGTATGFQTFAEMEEQAQQQQAQQQAMANAPAGVAAAGGETPPKPGAPGAPAKPGGPKPKPGSSGAKPGNAGQSPGHDAAESAANATAGKAPANGAPAKKMISKFTIADQGATEFRREAAIGAAAATVTASLISLARQHRDADAANAVATQQGLEALAEGYASVMQAAALDAQDAGLSDDDAYQGLDFSGSVAQRAEAQRSYLMHLLNLALTSPNLDWLPSRVNLYASSLYGAYNEGFGTAVQAAHPEYQLVWRLGSAEHCRLCLNRAGQVFTFQSLPGWPGDGGFGGADAICLGGQNCRCSLDYVENGVVRDSGGNTLEQAGYYAQQNQAIQAWRDEIEANADAFLASLPNETGADGSSVQERARSREDLRRELAVLLNARIRSSGGYGGVSVEPQDIPASVIASLIPQYGPVPANLPVTALMDAVDQFFAMKSAQLDLTKAELAGIIAGAVRDLRFTPTPTPTPKLPGLHQVRAELEAAARHLSKGRAADTWQRKHIYLDDLSWLEDLLRKGADRKTAVDTVMRRWTDIGGQVHEPAEDEPEPLPQPPVGSPEGDAAGWAGPVVEAHDADGITHRDRSALIPHRTQEQGRQIGPAIKGASDRHDPNPVDAEHVYSQLLENYPPKAIKWVKKARWIGPVLVPVDRVDVDSEASWAASHQPERVDHFKKLIEDGKDVKPGVSVQEPGENEIKIIDGHHRYLGAKAAGQDFWTYIGFVHKNGGVWDQTHVYQFHQGADPQNKTATLSKDAANYRQGTDALHRCRNCSMFIAFGDDEVGKCTLVQGDIRTDAVCDYWDRGAVKKAKKTDAPVAAGLAVRAADSGRVLMLQRALDDDDPAAGKWEFPGGRLEDDEEPLDAAVREWEEETGLDAPDVEPGAAWTGNGGVYRGFVVTIPKEDDLDVFGERDEVDNPDGDRVEALAWWDPADLDDNDAVRPELRADLDAILTALRARAVNKGFNSNQPRDAHGRFAPGGGHGSHGGSHGGGGAGFLKAGGNVDSSHLSLKQNGDVVHKPTGTVIGSVTKLPNTPVKGASTFITHHADGTQVYSSVYKGKALAAVAAHQNHVHSVASIPKPGEAKPPEPTVHAHPAAAPHVTPSKSPEPVKPKPWHKAGSNVDSKDLSLKVNGDVIHKPTGTVVGHVEKLKDTPVKGATTFITHHADGTKTYDSVYKGKALASVAQHHNAAMSGQLTHAKPEETAAAAEAPKKPYETAGHASNATAKWDMKADGSGVDITHKETGAKIGEIKEVSPGKLVVTHADGTVLPHDGGITSAANALYTYHNQKYADGVKPAEAAEPEKSAPAYHKAGTSVKPEEITVKKTGEVIHKPTGTQIGTMAKGQWGDWVPTHANGATGVDKIGHFNTKKEAVKQLVNKHNQTVAIETAVKPGAGGEWTKTHKAGAYNVVYHTTDPSGTSFKIGDTTVGTFKQHTDGTMTITHVSGATYTFHGATSVNSYQAKMSLATAHNQAAEIATGKPLEPKASTPVQAFTPHTTPTHTETTATSTGPKKPYEGIGDLHAFSPANVQKDPSGKIVSSDMKYGDTVIGHTEANPDGTVKLTHADGHVIDPSVKVGTGEVTSKLSQYHNQKYGDQTLPKPELAPVKKLEPTEVSLGEGGLHNEPAKQWKAAAPHQYADHWNDAASVAAGKSTLTTVKGSHTIGMTAAEKAAVGYYTGSGYTPMNQFLRHGKVSSYNQTTVIKHINNLDEAFKKAPELTKSITTYRGLSGGTKLFGPVGSKVGKTFTDDGYGSTATNPTKAFGGDVKLRVHIPAGTRIIRPGQAGTFGDQESEFLLARGTTYRIMRDEVVGNRRLIDVVVEGSAIQ